MGVDAEPDITEVSDSKLANALLWNANKIEEVRQTLIDKGLMDEASSLHYAPGDLKEAAKRLKNG